MVLSTAASPVLYREQVGRSTPRDEVDRCLHQLVIARSRWRNTALALRIRLARLCLAGTGEWADRWVAAACQAKGLDPDSPPASEEMATGPMAVSRYLQLLIATLSDIEKHGFPQLPGEIVTGPAGQLRVQVFPARGLFDPLLFRGFRGHAWMRPSVTRQNLPDHLAGEYRRRAATEGTALVLGAGNVAAIAATDMFAKLFHEGRVVLLKMNPVNEYLGTIFEAAFGALIEEGFLRVIYGGAEVGSYATHHELVDEVHITGSVQSHDTIVWGPPGPDRQWRLEHGGPLLSKPITSELGNVTPWIVVPGPYTDRQLNFQAENVAATIVNNASFNCIATKLIITWRGWPDRERFLDKVRAVLAGVPPRRAYYPGAFERFRRFTGSEAGDSDGTLPWTLIGGVDPDQAPHWFSQESFVCACAETALDAAGEEDFLDRAVEFANRRVWGTLGAGLMVHPRFRRRPGNEARFWRAVAHLRYGTVAINHWPALAYAMMTLPWGGYPGGTLADPQSGIGWVHNTYMLDGVEKSVLEGPLVLSPKPFWFPSHRQAHRLARKVLELYQQPRWSKLPGLVPWALLG